MGRLACFAAWWCASSARGDDSGPGVLVFKSMMKTGSAIVHERLKAAVGTSTMRRTLQHVGEKYAIPRGSSQSSGGKDFVVAGVREPCAWLLSAWAWASTGESIHRTCSQRGRGLPSWEPLAPAESDLDSAESVAIFQAWVRAHPGVMTHWYADALNPPATGTREAPTHSRGPATSGPPPPKFDFCDWTAPGDADRLREAMADPKHDRSVDCWVWTARLDADVDACLERAASHLAIAVDRGQYERMCKRPRDHLNTRPEEPPRGRPKGHCDRYFDKATLDFVFDSERVIFEAFNFTKRECCALPDADRSEL